jgi:hypothetical protein
MKQVFLSILFLYCCVAFGQNKQKKTLKFDNLEIVRNDIPYDSKDLFIFNFTNKTGKTVTVTEVKTSCGCTAAEKPAEPINKNKQGKISVSYDTKRVGVFTKTITVVTDQTEPIILTIKGNVLPEKP